MSASAAAVRSVLLYAGCVNKAENVTTAAKPMPPVHWRNYFVLFDDDSAWERIKLLGGGDWCDCDPLMLAMQEQIHAQDTSIVWDGKKFCDSQLFFNPPDERVPATVARISITSEQLRTWEQQNPTPNEKKWRAMRVACPRVANASSALQLGIEYILDEQQISE